MSGGPGLLMVGDVREAQTPQETVPGITPPYPCLQGRRRSGQLRGLNRQPPVGPAPLQEETDQARVRTQPL